MDERQRKSRYTWGSVQEFGCACKIALCNCGKYMRASSVEVPTVYLAYSWLSRRPDIGCKTSGWKRRRCHAWEHAVGGLMLLAIGRPIELGLQNSEL